MLDDLNDKGARRAWCFHTGQSKLSWKLVLPRLNSALPLLPPNPLYLPALQAATPCPPLIPSPLTLGAGLAATFKGIQINTQNALTEGTPKGEKLQIVADNQNTTG